MTTERTKEPASADGGRALVDGESDDKPRTTERASRGRSPRQRTADKLTSMERAKSEDKSMLMERTKEPASTDGRRARVDEEGEDKPMTTDGV